MRKRNIVGFMNELTHGLLLVTAAFLACGLGDLARMNGLENFCAAAINLVPSVLFLVGGRVVWGPRW